MSALTVVVWALSFEKIRVKLVICFLTLAVLSWSYLERGHVTLCDFPAHHFPNNNNAALKDLRLKRDALITFLDRSPASCYGWYLLEKTYRLLGQNIEASYSRQWIEHMCQQRA